MSVERYYLADSAYAYPSSNANDGGEDNSEYNLKTITDKFAIKSFVVRRSGKWETYFITTYHSGPPVGVDLTGGECSINGYYLDLKDTTILTTDSSGKTLLSPSTKYTIAIRLYKDGIGKLRGDGTAVVGTNVGELENRGIVVGLYTDEELEELDPELNLPLADFETDGNGNPPTENDDYHLRDDRFMFIDADTIIITETGQNIVDWVNSRIEYELSRLDKLQHWSDDDTTLESTLILSENDVIIDLKDYDPFSILAIEQRTHVAESGQYTEMELPTNGGDEQYKTYNGTSILLARSDHDHDGRYIVRKATDNARQTIYTPVKITGDFSIGTNDTFTVSATTGNTNIRGTTTSVGNVTVGSNKVTLNASNGNITATGDITGNRVFNAVWNDYADAVPLSEGCTVVPGNLISKKPKSKIYELATQNNRHLVVGVVSDTYGHLLGGPEGLSREEVLKTYAPIAVSGNVLALIKGKVNEGDFITVSDEKGVGAAVSSTSYTPGTVVGKALESKDSLEVGRILIQVMLV